MRRLIGTRKRKAVAAVLTSALVAGVGIAAWSIVTASGSGNAKVGSLVAPTITASPSPVANLVPNAEPSGSISFAITNPNASTLYLKQFTLDKTNVTGGTPSCDWGHPSFRNVYLGLNGHDALTQVATFPGGLIDPFSIAIPASGTTNVSVGPGVLRLNTNTPSDCQGTTIGGFVVTNAVFDTAP